jgi:hypothetical protein
MRKTCGTIFYPSSTEECNRCTRNHPQTAQLRSDVRIGQPASASARETNEAGSIMFLHYAAVSVPATVTLNPRKQRTTTFDLAYRGASVPCLKIHGDPSGDSCGKRKERRTCTSPLIGAPPLQKQSPEFLAPWKVIFWNFRNLNKHFPLNFQEYLIRFMRAFRWCLRRFFSGRPVWFLPLEVSVCPFATPFPPTLSLLETMTLC